MSAPIYLEVHAEDQLLAALASRLLEEFGGKYQPMRVERLGGKSNMDKKIRGWNAGARHGVPRLALRDLDSLASSDGSGICPESETARLLGKDEKSSNFILRFAVVESESWLLADGRALAKFLGVGHELRISSADAVKDPKAELIALARKSERRNIREGIPPEVDGKGRIGIAYNAILTEFVRKRWNPRRAAKRSKSLRRTLDRLAAFAGELPPR